VTNGTATVMIAPIGTNAIFSGFFNGQIMWLTIYTKVFLILPGTGGIWSMGYSDSLENTKFRSDECKRNSGGANTPAVMDLAMQLLLVMLSWQCNYQCLATDH